MRAIVGRINGRVIGSITGNGAGGILFGYSKVSGCGTAFRYGSQGMIARRKSGYKFGSQRGDNATLF